ncbi:MAG: DMT family transporter [Spirochaetales bacterium]|uniref:DMT family transporter n=1 Tax=Bullifex sp. TaxID=2815808 RepID=UPI002A51D8F5|nr:DMT family transporter [Bullifex sp.]MDD5972495.1 DMT family transporter [Spirochaetales bacterium]MDD7272329.1 DMT family transporter [Spirochaetales bacterium]MDY4067630.1 DMT family transporter [Bullifex sp.]
MDKITSVKKGIFFILLSALGFSIMNLCVTLAGDLPTFQKALFRNAGAMIVSFFLFLKSGDKLDLKPSDLGLLLMRALFGSVGLFANFYALDHMMISDASMLNKLAPFFTLLLSAIFLKEKTSIKQYLFVALAFVGVLFIVKPTMEFTQSMGASIVGVIGGFGAGAAYACVRGLGKRGMPSSQIVLGFSVVSTLIAIPFVINNHAPMSIYQICLLSLAAIGATVGQFGITWAYKAAPSKEISIFDYFTVIFSALWGFIFLSQVPDIYSLFGYLIIFTSALLMFFYNKRH